MKTRITNLTICICAIILFLTYGCNTIDPNSKEFATIENEKVKVLYHGVDNPLKIAILEAKLSDIEVSISNGIIEGANGKYVVKTENVGMAEITVSTKGRVVRVAEFKVKQIPNPQAAVKGITGEKVTKEALIAANELEVRMPEGFCFDIEFDIVSFSIAAVIGGYTKAFGSNSNSITKDQKRIIEQLRSGQTLVVTDIKSIGLDGSIRALSDIVYKID